MSEELSELQESNRHVIDELRRDAERVARERQTRGQGLLDLHRRFEMEATAAKEGVCGGAEHDAPGRRPGAAGHRRRRNSSSRPGHHGNPS